MLGNLVPNYCFITDDSLCCPLLGFLKFLQLVFETSDLTLKACFFLVVCGFLAFELLNFLFDR